MAHHRLFVAIRPPREVRAAILAAMGGIAGARWQDDEQLHCTLRFLGEVDGRVAEDVANALLRLRHPAIDISTGGWGSFAKAGVVDTLWLGISPDSGLRALHAKVGRLVCAAGATTDTRAFRPHVTIARFGRRAGPGEDAILRLPPPPGLTFRIGEVRLYESILGREGARYDVVARYPLD